MKTRNHHDADAFDLKVFNLIRLAADYANGKNAATMKEREQWEIIARALGRVRAQTQRMMHNNDIQRIA